MSSLEPQQNISISSTGFIALFAAVVISIALVVSVLASNFDGFFNRQIILDSYYKAESRVSAESCLRVATIRLYENDEYTGDEWITMGSSTCYILPIAISGTIETTATSTGNIYTNLKANFDEDTNQLKSVREVAVFGE